MTPSGDKAAREDKLILDKKLASLPKFVYDEKDVFTWAKDVRNYLIGQNRSMVKFLQWIEDFGSTEVTAEKIHALEHDRTLEACDLDYVQASEAMWSWINMISKTSNAQIE